MKKINPNKKKRKKMFAGENRQINAIDEQYQTFIFYNVKYIHRIINLTS